MHVRLRSVVTAVALVVFGGGVANAQEPMDISVDAVLARDIVDRMPADTGSMFSPDVGKLFLWTKVAGAEGESISHVWIHGPHEAAVELNVGGSPWRTWSSRKINPEWTGEWRVEVRNQAGDVLDTVTFTIG